MNIPKHPFIDYTRIERKENEKEQQHNHTIITKEMLEKLQLKPISHQEMIEKKKQTKPKTSEESRDKQYPKIRVSLHVFHQLKRYQQQLKCKSYCEVVSKLMEYYEGHDISTVNKSDD